MVSLNLCAYVFNPINPGTPGIIATSEFKNRQSLSITWITHCSPR
ncbi:MAG: hypothetical protein ACI9LO_002347 [Planctomycetota bacterium]|jgi:hypothetical protein